MAEIYEEYRQPAAPRPYRAVLRCTREWRPADEVVITHVTAYLPERRVAAYPDETASYTAEEWAALQAIKLPAGFSWEVIDTPEARKGKGK